MAGKRKARGGKAKPGKKASARLRESDRDDEDEPGQSFRTLRPRWGRLTESIYDGRNPDAGTADDDRFYQALDVAAALDLPPAFLQTAQRLSLLLYRKNVRACRTVELVKDFVLGDGPKIEAADPKVLEVLRRHWQANEWDAKAAERLRGLLLFGEQLWPAFTAEDGLVRITSVLPLKIKRLARGADDGERVEKVVVVLTGKEKAFDIIQEGKDERLAGDAFYFPINRVIGGGRGTPDMLSAIDWLEGLDGMIFALMERSSISQDVVFDIKYEGANRKEIQGYVKDFLRSLRAGGVYGHNEKATLKIQTPDLGASESETAIRVLLRQIQSGTGLAGLYFGDSDDLTRASASELSVPVAKMIQGKQETFKRILETVLRYQIEQAQLKKAIPADADTSFTVRMPRVYMRDLDTVARSLSGLASSLAVATDEGWVSEEQAGAAFRTALEQLGPVESGVAEETREGASAYGAALDRRRKDERGEAEGG